MAGDRRLLKNPKNPKNPKGSRDCANGQMVIREKAFSTVVNVFKMHGAMALDTPVFELSDTLKGKYGDDSSELIYDLEDQGGELLSLRYDLTVPFARYVAMNRLPSYKRYQIGKVYRRDTPSKGRYREFYQCDFDIAGDETFGADFEMIIILIEVLDELNIGEYEIKLNHRKLLDGILEICGVPSEKIRTVCSSIDKLDKQTFEQIKEELIVKGLGTKIVDDIGKYVKLRGHPLELLLELRKEGSEFLTNDSSKQALNDLEKLFQALDNVGCVDKVLFDLSLARGLDYYTGVIYEAVFKGATQVGSIAAGGRYDNLIGDMFGRKVAAIGVSIGIERIITIMEENQKNDKQLLRANETQVLVSIWGDDKFFALRLVKMCWDAKLKAQYLVSKRNMKHFDYATEFGIPWMVIVGEKEKKKGVVRLQNKDAQVEKEVPTSDFVDELVKLINPPPSGGGFYVPVWCCILFCVFVYFLGVVSSMFVFK